MKIHEMSRARTRGVVSAVLCVNVFCFYKRRSNGC